MNLFFCCTEAHSILGLAQKRELQTIEKQAMIAIAMNPVSYFFDCWLIYLNFQILQS